MLHLPHMYTLIGDLHTSQSEESGLEFDLLSVYFSYFRPAATYETATTRQFYHGRTETVRSCTTEAVTWVKAMLDQSTLVSNDKDGCFYSSKEEGTIQGLQLGEHQKIKHL